MSIKVTLNKGGLKKLLKASQGTLVEFAEKATEISARLAPFITGHLQRNIDWEEGPQQRGVVIFTRTGYGGWVEIGTSRMEGQRFMGRGVGIAAGEVLGE